MSDEKGSKLSGALRWLGDKLAILLAGSWSTLLVAYVVHAEFRAWVLQLVGRVGEVVPAALAIAGLVSAGYVVVKYWRRVVWWLAIRPASRAFGVEANEKLDGMTPYVADLLRERLETLDADCLWVLEGILARRKPGSDEVVVEYPDGMRLRPMRQGAGTAKPVFEQALATLKGIGAIAGWESVGEDTDRGFRRKVLLPKADWRTLERLRVVAEVQRGARHYLNREMADAMTQALIKLEQGPKAREMSPWAQEVDEFSISAAWLLFRILLEYRHQPPGDVMMLHSELKALADQIHVPLPKVRESCGELVGARFLEDFDWRADDAGIHLVARLAERVKSNKVGYELMLAIGSRMEAEGAWGSSASP